MAELKDNLGPYVLETALAADRADDSCYVLNVGRDENGNVTSSLKHVNAQVDNYLINVYDRLVPVTKLYVIGEWKSARAKKDSEQASAPEEQKRYANEPHWSTKSEQNWHDAGEQIAKLVEQMPALKELTWISDLPFMAVIWTKLSTSLTKLVLDLGQPVRLQQDGENEYKSYISPAEMRPLVQQTELEELRLFNMHDSYQSIYWETVFRNTSKTGMRVLDLDMAAPPIVRKDHWHKAADVRGLTVPKIDSKEKEYKGIDGKGVLHYSFGTGEYLDDFSMRKGRIAAGLEEAIPFPLRCLKLNGFVVDYLPFEQELSRIALLTCGKDCVDSGLRAPKTSRNPHSREGKVVKNHCLIQWPSWTGVFDDRGDPIPLTKESLQMKDLGEALDGAAKEDGYFSAKSPWSPGSAVTSHLQPQEAVSSASPPSLPVTDGETPVILATTGSPVADGNTFSGATSPTGASLVLVDSATSEDSIVSNGSSFDQILPADIDEASVKPATAVKDGSFKHKVRTSWDWLSGSGSGAAS
ncbi:uncharacterized protein J4E88_007615 [Alternaria novae-zelandiae]|uniref:uncharacterized protein n=1 Tax=Alternaria novae-zelandiae TaxID=430562 RepID=UPI0020C36432|nr:uncharacterized protein J4E88_007615 [Alternaria novae-zelandiae]KAI4675582.1 hypothetical protein J4E88_007615 [Alternaria novae-zelandiae]